MSTGRPWTILHGDVRRVCKTQLEENSFDAFLGDPPYGLKFMGRGWDYSVPSAMLWSEVERVVKPGAPGIAFGGSRTFHRLTCGVEDGGFEIRDVMMWLYGEGFPKSTNVSKALAKMGGDPKEIAKWEGYGSALKPGYEPILLVRKYPEGTFIDGAVEHGTGPLAIDACRVASDEALVRPAVEREALNAYGSGLGAGTQTEPGGRWPANVILTHGEGCTHVGMRTAKGVATKYKSTGQIVSKNVAMSGDNYGRVIVGVTERPDEEVWECAPGCPIGLLDEQSGDRPSTLTGRADPNVAHAHPANGERTRGSMFGNTQARSVVYADSGGASRFFYTCKAGAFERESGLEAADGERGNTHTTVKPIDLIRYLARLILPPKRATPRRILVPFSGSGSEMIGCLQAGWDEVVGIEREAEYVAIAKTRITKGGVFSKLVKPARKSGKRAAP